jgi:hypothetical protein
MITCLKKFPALRCRDAQQLFPVDHEKVTATSRPPKTLGKIHACLQRNDCNRNNLISECAKLVINENDK